MFLLEGFGPSGPDLSRDTRIEILEAAAAQDLKVQEELQPHHPPESDYDARVRVMRQIVARRGQKKFREQLLEAYSRRCAVTGCDVVDVLEAAHIRPYRGPDSNVVSNGLLLRADLHTLFDLQLISVEPTSRRVKVSRKLQATLYAELDGVVLRSPMALQDAPPVEALAGPYALFVEAEHGIGVEFQNS
jgi:predicted restriction endonuclease